jgi:hypothetical protein
MEPISGAIDPTVDLWVKLGFGFFIGLILIVILKSLFRRTARAVTVEEPIKDPHRKCTDHVTMCIRAKVVKKEKQ